MRMSRSSSFLTSSLMLSSSCVGRSWTTNSTRHCVRSAANWAFEMCDLRGGLVCTACSCRDGWLWWKLLSVGEYTAAMGRLRAVTGDPATRCRSVLAVLRLVDVVIRGSSPTEIRVWDAAIHPVIERTARRPLLTLPRARPSPRSLPPLPAPPLKQRLKRLHRGHTAQLQSASQALSSEHYTAAVPLLGHWPEIRHPLSPFHTRSGTGSCIRRL